MCAKKFFHNSNLIHSPSLHPVTHPHPSIHSIDPFIMHSTVHSCTHTPTPYMILLTVFDGGHH